MSDDYLEPLAPVIRYNQRLQDKLFTPECELCGEYDGHRWWCYVVTAAMMPFAAVRVLRRLSKPYDPAEGWPDAER